MIDTLSVHGTDKPTVGNGKLSKTVFTMSGVKKYFKQEGQLCMLGLEHPKPSDFYLSVWQTNRSSVTLLIFRSLLFLMTTGIVISSITLYALNGHIGYWFIYLTHWGLTLEILATAFSVAVSARCYIYGPISADLPLPWFFKTYWVFFNAATPIAFLITIFYWSILYKAGVSEELSPGLDVAVHGLNSLVMFLLLMSASHPSRILHVYHPFIFALLYVTFGLIYHFAGGVNTYGEPWVYPVVNWANPGPTVGVAALTGLLLVMLHLLTVGIAKSRDVIARKLVHPRIVDHTEEAVALRQRTKNDE